jgi:hypothetical protein
MNSFSAQLVASVLAATPTPETRMSAAMVQLKTARDAMDAGDIPAARLFLADAIMILREISR